MMSSERVPPLPVIKLIGSDDYKNEHGNESSLNEKPDISSWGQTPRDSIRLLSPN